MASKNLVSALTGLYLLSFVHGVAMASDATPPRAIEADGDMEISFVQRDRGWAPLHFERFNGLIFFKAKINGVNADVLLDSGTESTTLDESFARKLGLEKIRQLSDASAGRARLPRYQLGGMVMEIPNLVRLAGPVQAIDFRHASSLLGHPVDAILGGDVLKGLALAVFADSDTLSFARSGNIHVNENTRAIRIPIFDGDKISALIDGKPAKLLIDLGASNAVVLSDEVWPRFVSVNAEVKESAAGNADGVARVIQESPGHSLTVGAVEFRQTTISRRAMTSDKDGLLGNGFLSRFTIILDEGAGTLILLPVDVATNSRDNK